MVHIDYAALMLALASASAQAESNRVDTARNYVRRALAEAMDSKPVSEAVTQPYGCNVKYAD